jgi:stearoyl-CoA desaturase (delta-9 desaturase)
MHWRDLALAVVLYLVTGHGVTVGFHRLFTHRSFKAARPLELGLAVAGSLAVQGSLLSWVAIHRRHHAYSDRAGDPHSPHDQRTGPLRRLRGLSHAHVGWLFGADTTAAERFAPDLLRDRGLVLVSRLFPMWAVLSLGVPFAIGWVWSQTITGALSAMLWAGVARMALLHHVTWSVNSICHTFGRRPYATHDESTNFSPLALVSLGESWHNFHHAVPSSARHGIGRRQVDSSAAVIRLMERVGWAFDVRWPSAARVRQCRRSATQ